VTRSGVYPLVAWRQLVRFFRQKSFDIAALILIKPGYGET